MKKLSRNYSAYVEQIRDLTNQIESLENALIVVDKQYNFIDNSQQLKVIMTTIDLLTNEISKLSFLLLEEDKPGTIISIEDFVEIEQQSKNDTVLVFNKYENPIQEIDEMPFREDPFAKVL